MNRTQAARFVTIFEKHARADELKGSDHPALRPWIHERYLIARERMIRKLVGDQRPTDYMPRYPKEIDW